MSLISQIAIVFLALFILIILFRANRDLDRVAMEEEHFIDSWALMEERQKALEQGAGPGTGEAEEMEEELEEEHTEPEKTKPESRKETAARPAFCLLATDEIYQTSREVPICRTPFTIGRGADNDLVLDDLSVARRHGVIRSTDQGLVLKDQGSKGHIRVGDEARSEVRIYDGQVFYMGNTRIEVAAAVSRSEHTRLYAAGGM